MRQCVDILTLVTVLAVRGNEGSVSISETEAVFAEGNTAGTALTDCVPGDPVFSDNVARGSVLADSATAGTAFAEGATKCTVLEDRVAEDGTFAYSATADT